MKIQNLLPVESTSSRKMNSIFPANKQQFLKIESTAVQARKFQRIIGSDGQSMAFWDSVGLQMSDCSPSGNWDFIKLTDHNLAHPWRNIHVLTSQIHSVMEVLCEAQSQFIFECIPRNQTLVRYLMKNQTTILHHVSLLDIRNAWQSLKGSEKSCNVTFVFFFNQYSSKFAWTILFVIIWRVLH